MLYKTTLLLALLFWGCEYPFQNEQSPEDLIWIYVESAEQQCITPDYSSLEDAVNQLKDNDITVLGSRETNYPVCEACSCPTGISYGALIYVSDQNVAFELGWQRVDEGDDTQD